VGNGGPGEPHHHGGKEERIRGVSFGQVLASVARYKFSQYTSTLKRTQRGMTVSVGRKSTAAANIARLKIKRVPSI
jgi:hypothetical protein